MNIYKVPNLVISPKSKVYRRGEGGGGGGVQSTTKAFTHTHTHSLTLSHTHTDTHIYHSVRKRRLLGQEKMHL